MKPLKLYQIKEANVGPFELLRRAQAACCADRGVIWAK